MKARKAFPFPNVDNSVSIFFLFFLRMRKEGSGVLTLELGWFP
jgi:hypothetical protein